MSDDPPSSMKSAGSAGIAARAAGLLIVRGAAVLACTVSFVSCAVPEVPTPATGLRQVKLLALNDLHGHLATDNMVAGRPAGGAAVIAAYLSAARANREHATVIVNAGDNVGASPLVSGLLRDEPTVSFYNLLANEACRSDRMHVRCNVVSTLGNHEFDRGAKEARRLLDGGNAAPELDPSNARLVWRDPWDGAQYPTVNVNVERASDQQLLLPPFVIRNVNGARVAFIGAVLRGTPSVVLPAGVAGLNFLDEAASINAQLPKIRAQGADAVVLLIHEGGRQTAYEGLTRADAGPVTGAIAAIVAALEDGVDVVVSGHTHSFTNAILKNRIGGSVLVTQAYAYGTAFAEIDMTVDVDARRVVAKQAKIITTFADQGPGLTPDPKVAQLVDEASRKVAPVANRVVGSIGATFTRTVNTAGESPLGQLIADAQRAATGADIALMNPGGIRADLRFTAATAGRPAGVVTFNDVFTAQPFSNPLVTLTLTGAQIKAVLEQQFTDAAVGGQPRILQVSGLRYRWRSKPGVGTNVFNVTHDGKPLVDSHPYSVTVNAFLAGGGDQFSVLAAARDGLAGPLDAVALADYLLKRSTPPSPATGEARIERVD